MEKYGLSKIRERGGLNLSEFPSDKKLGVYNTPKKVDTSREQYHHTLICSSFAKKFLRIELLSPNLDFKSQSITCLERSYQ